MVGETRGDARSGLRRPRCGYAVDVRNPERPSNAKRDGESGKGATCEERRDVRGEARREGDATSGRGATLVGRRDRERRASRVGGVILRATGADRGPIRSDRRREVRRDVSARNAQRGVDDGGDAPRSLRRIRSVGRESGPETGARIAPPTRSRRGPPVAEPPRHERRVTPRQRPQRRP